MNIKLFFPIILMAMPAPALADTAPLWINVLPTDNNKIYALGLSPKTSPISRSITSASNNAKQELLFSLRTTIQGSTTSMSAMQHQKDLKSGEKASSFNQIRSNTTLTTSATDLPGLKVVETYIDNSGDSVFALAEFDISQAEASLSGKNQLVTNKVEKLISENIPDLDQLAEIYLAYEESRKALDMLGLIEGHIDPTLAKSIRKNNDQLKVYISTAKKNTSFGLLGSNSLASRMAGSVRPIVTAAGYTWSDDSPRYRIAARYIFGPEQNATYGMIVLRATQEVVLIDSNDNVIKSTKLSLKGVGGTEGQAMLQMETRMDEQLKSTLANWLGTGGLQK